VSLPTKPRPSSPKVEGSGITGPEVPFKVKAMSAVVSVSTPGVLVIDPSGVIKQGKASVGRGLLFCLFSGLGSALVGLGLQYGQPAAQAAQDLGADPMYKNMAAFMPLMVAGGIRFAQRHTQMTKTADGKVQTIKIDYEKVTVNEVFPPSLFAVPSVSNR